MPHPKKLDAAIRRRDGGARPFPRDNEALLAAGQRTNPRPQQPPEAPRRGTHPDLVLQHLQSGEATVPQLANWTKLSELQVRSAIDALRAAAYDIVRVRRLTFALMQVHRRSA